jgi:hypothetical protein
MLTKVCTGCNLEKTVYCFHKSKLGKYGVAAVCKDCRTAYRKQYNKLNRATARKYQQDHSDEHKSANLRYRQANKKIIAEKNKKYRKDNSDKVNANTALRRASKLQATPPWIDLESVKAIYKQAAEATINGIPTHVDHIVPLRSNVVCGLHCEANLQLLSSSNNASKGNRWWPDMW